MALIISTFLSMIMIKKAAYSYNQLYVVESLDIYSQKMRYISLLEFYGLGKKCLGVLL